MKPSHMSGLGVPPGVYIPELQCHLIHILPTEDNKVDRPQGEQRPGQALVHHHTVLYTESCGGSNTLCTYIVAGTMTCIIVTQYHTLLAALYILSYMICCF